MKIHTLFQPHFRLIYLFIWGFIISGLQNINWLITLNISVMFTFILFISMGKQDFFLYFQRWIRLLIFIALMWTTLSWRIEENGIEFYPQGIRIAEILSLRTNLLLFSVWLFLWNINETVLIQALGKLPLPEKLIQLFALTVRYIALLGELRQKMDRAMRARGYQPKFNFRTLYVTAQSVALLLIHALLKAEMAQIALKCRGFQFGKRKEDAER
ncbi:energy-coupling factor transporter transmembrane component T family protein [Rodentibacter pneumotropicus]|uniref:Energy-coupling factor transporter transmembrane protein EcfT n=2 Tax=Rodentibacter pneumotropicus TaxID=758 RepID=A0A1V3K9B2_9PAST|nr:energy-coupling factor transporter transmembrane component T [Rodentibacter pneumotropicus]MCQ9121041.1 energy-coupling factor transporter transmembrane protein EcfT [Rodentibacter pneumotropicus]NBH75047.1 energy-coupling factor transporter transmembrane protein EcfT [Rodentibacter pneumotropicus]OOF61699.1 ABC transporter permease [Rodentibacter pneumotropicus]OOF69201.1 ABC transporter permease [Rodentibacter pneumotropicus]TGZ99442.1 energy-coupling factor transporter transmembrane prot